MGANDSPDGRMTLSSNPIDHTTLKRIKRHAKLLKKKLPGKTYMQNLDIAAHELTGVRHYHEARVIARRSYAAADELREFSPWLDYARTCQAHYFEI